MLICHAGFLHLTMPGKVSWRLLVRKCLFSFVRCIRHSTLPLLNFTLGQNWTITHNVSRFGLPVAQKDLLLALLSGLAKEVTLRR